MADVDIMGLGSQVVGLGFMGVGLGMTLGIANMVQRSYQPYRPRRPTTTVRRPVPIHYTPYRPLSPYKPQNFGYNPKYTWRI